jgi:3-dehydroquinate synthase|tara:strand:- start:666 stop:1775 length:1110 start_codon:yes stop_codon:yes gene_type:complete
MTSVQHTLTVELGNRSYPIYIGSGLLQQAQLLRQHITGKQVMVVTNSTVARLYLKTVLDGLQSLQISGLQVDSLVLEDGEQHKHLDTVSLIFDHLLQQRHDRTTTLIALGGGVIGDMTGYAAAAYQRGVNFIQIPTTLLSQVDSSVGGKTGVNHPLGKNMIGAFHQPQCVIIDIQSLQTLPARELSAGLAEVIKYGLIAEPDFFTWLEQNIDQLRQLAPHLISQAIYQSCECKAAIVAADEREHGQRALLNFGHTFGHAIETEMGYGNWLHGEAVGAGMAMAADLSCRLGWISHQQVQRIQSLLQASGLPLWGPDQMHAETYLTHMQVDKKVTDGTIRLILLQQLGEAIVTSDFGSDLLHQTLKQPLAG